MPPIEPCSMLERSRLNSIDLPCVLRRKLLRLAAHFCTACGLRVKGESEEPTVAYCRMLSANRERANNVDVADRMASLPHSSAGELFSRVGRNLDVSAKICRCSGNRSEIEKKVWLVLLLLGNSRTDIRSKRTAPC